MKSPIRLPPAYSRKPDPDEPWRYACPECGRQAQGTAKRYYTPYHCPDHGTFTKDELVDKKTEAQA